MNSKQKTLIILSLSLILLASIAAVSAVDYTLTNADMDYVVRSNGLLHVHEAITYDFDSSPNGVYRDIPLKSGQSVENLEVYVDGAYAEYQIIPQGSGERIKVYLYTDSSKSHKLSSDSVITVHYVYDMPKAVKIYNDIGELQYKVWGEEWDEDLENLQSTITFPDDEELQFWINPYFSNAKARWAEDHLKIHSDFVGDGKYVEARALIPLSEFDSDAEYAQHINKNGKDEIIKIQDDDKKSQEGFKSLFSILNKVLVVLCFIPGLIYLKFGREPKTTYDAIYEHEPPTDDPPAYVNGMIGSGLKDVGSLNQEAFQATIMDLINRGKMGVSSEEDTEFTKTTFLTIKDTSGLKRFEADVINILKRYELNGKISLSYMQDCLRGESEARYFQGRFESWKENFENEYFSEDSFSRLFDKKGNDYLNYFAFLLIILGVIAFIASIFFDFAVTGSTIFVGVLLVIVGVVCLMLPSGIAGKYTDEGKLYEEKWMKFKKYLQDYSLIKEHPPESIVIWNKYLVYATALGVADEVYKAMKMEVYSGSDDYYRTNDLYMFYYLGGHRFINDSFNTASSTISAADNSSVGGIGGGSGGGGGGAF